ncbi:hypothetical protein M8J76_010196 [Diaphorina citri]|nr:hypothetical protein M8J76_010196 [Diaphorina citri]
MPLHMRLKVNLLARPIRTEVTFKWFLAQVAARVVHNIAALIREIITRETDELELLRIGPDDSRTFLAVLNEKIDVVRRETHAVNARVLWKLRDHKVCKYLKENLIR